MKVESGKMKSPLQYKSFQFALQIIRLSRHLKTTYNEFDIARQILKSGTSIGANIREAKNAQSSNDFVSKLSIALKEADETEYWLDLIHESKLMADDDYQNAIKDLKELIAMLTSSIKTSKSKQ
jgi:four helix bundle protein